MKKTLFVITLFFISFLSSYSQNLEEILKADTLYIDVNKDFNVYVNKKVNSLHSPCYKYHYYYKTISIIFDTCKWIDENFPDKKIIDSTFLKNKIVIDLAFLKKTGFEIVSKIFRRKKFYFYVIKNNVFNNKIELTEASFISTYEGSINDYITNYIENDNESECYDSKFFKLVFNEIKKSNKDYPITVSFGYKPDITSFKKPEIIKLFNVNEYETLLDYFEYETLLNIYKDYEVCDIIKRDLKVLEESFVKKTNSEYVNYIFSEPLRITNEKFVIFQKLTFVNKSLKKPKAKQRMLIFEKKLTSKFALTNIIDID